MCVSIKKPVTMQNVVLFIIKISRFINFSVNRPTFFFLLYELTHYRQAYQVILKIHKINQKSNSIHLLWRPTFVLIYLCHAWPCDWFPDTHSQSSTPTHPWDTSTSRWRWSPASSSVHSGTWMSHGGSLVWEALLWGESQSFPVCGSIPPHCSASVLSSQGKGSHHAQS